MGWKSRSGEGEGEKRPSETKQQKGGGSSCAQSDESSN